VDVLISDLCIILSNCEELVDEFVWELTFAKRLLNIYVHMYIHIYVHIYIYIILTFGAVGAVDLGDHVHRIMSVADNLGRPRF